MGKKSAYDTLEADVVFDEVDDTLSADVEFDEVESVATTDTYTEGQLDSIDKRRPKEKPIPLGRNGVVFNEGLQNIIDNQAKDTGLYPETPIQFKAPKVSQEQVHDNLKKIFSSTDEKTAAFWNLPQAREKLYNNLSKQGYDVDALRESGERFVNAKTKLPEIAKAASQTDDPALAYEYATALGDVGDHAAAFSIYTDLVKRGNHSPDVYKGLAYSLYKMGDEKEAQRALGVAQQMEEQDKQITGVEQRYMKGGMVLQGEESIEDETYNKNRPRIAEAIERLPVYSQAKGLMEGFNETVKGLREAKELFLKPSEDIIEDLASGALRGVAAAGSGAISYLMNTTPIGLAFVEATHGLTGEGTKKIITPVINQFIPEGKEKFTSEEAMGLLTMPITTVLEKNGVKDQRIKDVGFLGDMIAFGVVAHAVTKPLVKGMSAEQVKQAGETATKIIKGEKVTVEELRNVNQFVYENKSFRDSFLNPTNDLKKSAKIYEKAQTVANTENDIANAKSPVTQGILQEKYEKDKTELNGMLKEQSDESIKIAENDTKNEVIDETVNEIKSDLENLSEENKVLAQEKITELEKEKISPLKIETNEKTQKEESVETQTEVLSETATVSETPVIPETLGRLSESAVAETKTETPLGDAYRDRLLKLKHEPETAIEDIQVGDFIRVKGDEKSSGTEGFVKKIAPKNLTIETTYGGWGGADVEMMELKIPKANVTSLHKVATNEGESVLANQERTKAGISGANKIATENDFKSATHLLNSIKKYTGEDFPTVQEAIKSNPEIINQTKKLKEDAKSLRENEGQVQETGDVRQERQSESSENLQLDTQKESGDTQKPLTKVGDEARIIFAGSEKKGKIIEESETHVTVQDKVGMKYPVKKTEILQKGETPASRFEKQLDVVAEKIKKKLKPKSLEGKEVSKAGLGVDEVIDGAVKIIKEARKAKIAIGDAIDSAVKYMKDNWNNKWGAFDEKYFRGNIGAVSLTELDIRKLQKQARKVKHTSFGTPVKEFTSINPSSIPQELLPDYLRALDELRSPVPNYETVQKIYFDIVRSKEKDFSNIKTFKEAEEIFDNIFKNEIKSVEDYRSLFKDINGLKRRLNQLVDDGTITEEQFTDIFDLIGENTKKVQEKFAPEITSMKTDLINEVEKIDTKDLTTEEKRIIDKLNEQTNDDLRKLDPEDLADLVELTKQANNGYVDMYRFNNIVNLSEARRRGVEVAKQFESANNPFTDVSQAANKLSKHEAAFIEGAMGLGRAKVGAFGKFITSTIQRAAGDYTKGIKDTYKKFLELKKQNSISKEAMDKFGIITTYLQEYTAQFDPKWKNVKDIGSRDWFGELLTDNKKQYNKKELKAIQKVYDSLPKKDGKVDVQGIYESITNKDGNIFSAKEQTFFDQVMKLQDSEVRGKQEAANAIRGKEFTPIQFYMPRIGKAPMGDIEVKYERGEGRVRIKSGFGEERTTQKIRPIETNFEKLFIKSTEAANRDYYFNDAIDLVNKTLSVAAKEATINKELANIAANNVADMMKYEFESKNKDLADKVATTLTSARAATTLFDPKRTLFTELPSTALQVPLRAGSLSGFKEYFTSNKNIRSLLEFTESPLRLRENINKNIEIDEGTITPQNRFTKATYFLAGLPERLTFKGAWLPTFKAEFKSITGEDFNQNLFNTSKEYQTKNSRAIKESGSAADLTTEKIIGGTTKLSQNRELQLPFTDKGISKQGASGKILGFFGNYPRREYLEFTNGFKEVAERYQNGEGFESFGSLTKPAGVAIGAMTYAYGSFLAYNLTTQLFGTDNEKKKAKEQFDKQFTLEGLSTETAGQVITLFGSKYYGIGRAMGQLGLSAAHAYADEKTTKDKIASIMKDNYYQGVVILDSKSYKANNNKEKIAYWMARFIPQFSIIADNVNNVVGGEKEVQRLYKEFADKGLDAMTKDDQNKLALVDLMFKTATLVANINGTSLPMKNSLQQMLRGAREEKKISTSINTESIKTEDLILEDIKTE